MPTIKELPNGKKTQVFDPSDPEDMRIASELAKQQYEKLKGKSETEAKLNEAEDAQKLFSEIKSNVEKQYIDEGLQMPTITDKDSLDSATKNLLEIQKLKSNQHKDFSEGEGIAPLNSAQEFGGQSGFSSEAEMIDSILTAKHRGNEDAQKILDQLFVKTLKGQKESEQSIKTFKPEKDAESEIERINRIKREKHHNYVRDF